MQYNKRLRPIDMWETSAEIPLWWRDYPDLGSASDWLKQIPSQHNQSEARPISG